MNGLKKIWEWIKRPHGLLLIPFYLVTLAAVIGAIIFAVGGDAEYAFLAYIVYAVAAVTLGYAVYTLVLFAPRAKRKITALLQRFSFTNKLMEQYGFRTVAFAVVSFAISLGYVLFNGVIALVELSVWYGALAGYYLVLAIMRGEVLFFHRKKRGRINEKQTEKRRREVKIYRLCGVGLILLPLCLSFAILQMVIGENSFEHAGLTIYVSATYAFYKITMSVINAIKARSADDMTVRALRSINLADSFVSILALQTAMFKEFSDGTGVGVANALTGGVVCALTAALGIYMIIKANTILKTIRRNKSNGRKER